MPIVTPSLEAVRMSSANSLSDPGDAVRRDARRHRAGRGPAVAVALGYLLVACTSSPEPVTVRCPKVAVVYGLDAVEPLQTRGRSLPAEARLQGLQGSCGYDAAGLALDYSLDILVRPRAPLAPTSIDLPYFVAVAAPDGRIIDKQVFTARIALDGKAPTGSRERIVQTLAGVGPDEGPGYRVLIGFELPRERAIEQWRRRGI